MKFYYVCTDYIHYLQKIDSKNVQNNYENEQNQKPYIGIVLSVNDKHYFAPLSSDKNERYKNIDNSNPTVFKLITNNGNYLGVIKLNNMIPIQETNLIQITNLDIAKKDEKYQKLLNIQRLLIRKNKETIQKKADNLYRLVVEKRNTFYCSISAKFSELEQACENYSKQK